jgi:hypothetical protein
MHSQLGVQVGRSVDLWLQQAQTSRAGVVTSPRPSASAPVLAPQDQQAVSTVLKDRPDLSLALQRLAGIDPAKRQEEYEAIRRELLRISQDGAVELEMSTEGDGSAAAYASLAEGEAEPETPETPAQVPLLSPQAVLLSAYQQVSRPELPTSLLASRVV